MALARRASSNLGMRSIHLRIQPRPANLSESREIYRVLQRFGEISTYKSLRYEYHNPADNIALAIYRTADAAQAALNASPLRFSLEKVADNGSEPEFGAGESSADDIDEAAVSPSRPANDGIDDMMAPSPLLNTSLPPSSTTSTSSPSLSPPMPFVPQPTTSPSSPPTQKYFHITLDRSRVIHADFISRQPYWKQFSPMQSLASSELRKTVPLYGLSDVSKRPPNAHRTPNKVLRVMSEYVEKRMPTVRDMWAEAQEGRREDGDVMDMGRGGVRGVGRRRGR